MTLGCIADYGMAIKWVEDNKGRIDQLVDLDKSHEFCCSSFTPLEMMVIAHERDLVEKLINRGAKTDNIEFMMIHTGWGVDDIAKLCYQHGEKPGFAMMSAAVRQGDKECLQWLLDKGGTLHEVALFDVAVSCNNVEFVNWLLLQGAALSPNSLSLALSRQEGSVDMTRFLLERGASVRERRYLIDLLIMGKSRPDEERIRLLALLLEFGANANEATEEGATPLMFASARGALDIIRLLIRHGADRRVRNKDGFMAIDFAKKRDQQEAVAILTAAEAEQFAI